LDINRSAKFPYTRLSEVKQQSPVELDIGSNIGSNYSDNSEFENADDSDTDPDYVQSSDDDNETEDSFGEDDDTDCEIDRKRSRSTCVDGDTSAKTSNKSQVKACDHTKSYLLKHRVTSSHETNAESRLQSDLSVGNNENLYEAQEQNDNLNENENSNEAEQQNDDNVNENQKPTSSITVARSHKTRVFDKRPHCYYCGVQQSQVQRHWLTKHSTEREVIEIDMCKDRNKKWRLIARLRNLGNHFHNVEVIRAGKGELMVTHRKSSEVEALNYVPCDQCYAYVLKRELWRHKCKFGKPDKGRKISSAQLLLPAPSNVQPEVHELLSSMKDDNVRFLAKCDGLIVEYAKKMIHVKGMKKKLAKIFILMEKGQLAMHKGKTLEELMSEVTEDSGNISEHLSIKDIHIEGEERVVSKVDKCVDMERGYLKPQWTSISCTIIEPLTIYSCLTLSLQ